MKITKLLAAVLTVSAFAACSDDNDPVSGNQGNNGNDYPDPSGTVSLTVMNADHGETPVGESGIFINSDNRFTGGSFAMLGEMKGVADVKEIPSSGWTESVAVTEGAGYAAYSEAQKRFYRIYVTELILDEQNKPTGAEIKYHTPFRGAEELIVPASESVTFGSEGGEREVLFTNGSIIPFTVEAEGCEARPLYTTAFDFLPNGVTVTAAANGLAEPRTGSVILTNAYGNVTEIRVKVEGGEPYMEFEPVSLDMPYSGGAPAVTLRTNVDFSQVTVSSDKDWCRAERSDTPGEWTVTVDVNAGESERTARLTASAAGTDITAELLVEQGYLVYSLSDTELGFGRLASQQTVTVSPVELVPEASADADWCSCEVFSNTVTVSVAPNDTGADRSATVTVSVNGVPKTVAVKQGRYDIGDYYDAGGVQGVVYSVQGFNGSIVSMDESLLKWSTEYNEVGATDENDGRSNMSVIKGQPDWNTVYPAFAWCEAKNTGGVTGWYLPALNEVVEICSVYERVNAALEARGAQILTNGHYYWSSTESGMYSAKYVQFWNGFVTQYYKKDNYSVRAVRRY